MSAAFAGGITVFVTPPLGDGVLVGYSAAFYTRGQVMFRVWRKRVCDGEE